MIAESTLQALRASLRGPVVVPQDSDYDEVRRIHNAMIDRHPAAIVRCAGVADVVAAVKFARQHALLVAVRGAGHNIAGTSLCEGGVVIDLSRMKSVRVDPARSTVRVEAGATWADLNHELQVFGLAATGGRAAVDNPQRGTVPRGTMGVEKRAGYRVTRYLQGSKYRATRFPWLGKSAKNTV